MSFCHALFVLVAVTLVSGQYLHTTTYEDIGCAIGNGGFSSSNEGVSCSATPGCFESKGFYFKQSCVNTDPFEYTADALAIQYFYTSINTSCVDYTFANAAPYNKCTANQNHVYKITGCNADNSSIIITYYNTKTDCENNNTPIAVEAKPSSTCVNDENDLKYYCPVVAPVTAPLSSTPSAGPVAGTPTSASPKAATPVKKSSSASNVMIRAVSLTTMLLVLA